MNVALDDYYARMTSALGDKVRVLDYVVGDLVLDVGCGSGDLMDELTARGVYAHGLDASQESVDRAGGFARLGYADEAHEIFGENVFTTVICSSVFHEVFSYGNRDGRVGRIESIARALQSLHKTLKPGGRLIIRDGVMPSLKPDYYMQVDRPDEVEKFLKHSPFVSDKYDRQIEIRRQDDSHIFWGSASSLMEFAFTYTWGETSFEREVQEFYGVFEFEEYAHFVQRHGFQLEHSELYTQPGYKQHLQSKVHFSMPFPQTNAIWVYTKVDA